VNLPGSDRIKQVLKSFQRFFIPNSPCFLRSSFMAERILDRAFPVTTIFSQSSLGF
jgi:hypothetical protein